MYCSKCGKENNEEANFCKYCGEKLIIESNSVISKELKDKDKKFFRWVLVFVGILFIGTAYLFVKNYFFPYGYSYMNDSLQYGETNTPRNCRAIIKENIDNYNERIYSAEEVLFSIDRNCGEFGYSWMCELNDGFCLDDSGRLKYGETGLPKNCRAIIKENIDNYNAKIYSAEDILSSIDRNCGEFGYSW